jgi:hypothetical protein
MTPTKLSPGEAVTALFVAALSAQADRTEAVLRANGLTVTRAENVCFAEIYAEAQRFAAAIYDRSLSQEEQASLARVMRIRWPWMRILRWVPSGDELHNEDLFDWSVRNERELADCVALRLAH